MSKASERAAKCAQRTIALTQQDPVDRLKEFCRQALYQYQFSYDVFANGVMCECLIYLPKYGRGTAKKTEIAKEARFVSTTAVLEAQRVVSAILLDRLGLGDDSELEIGGGEDSFAEGDVPETEPNDPIEEVHSMARKAMSFASGLLNSKLVSNLDLPDEVRDQLSAVVDALPQVPPTSTFSQISKNEMSTAAAM